MQYPPKKLSKKFLKEFARRLKASYGLPESATDAEVHAAMQAEKAAKEQK